MVSEKSKKLILEEGNNIEDNINLKGITRSEFIIVNDIPYILETNTVPGFTQQSIVPQQIEAQKLKVRDVINDLVSSIL
jgi:D-alanine-D-alanine ligase and related ATP-grasp enzymes